MTNGVTPSLTDKRAKKFLKVMPMEQARLIYNIIHAGFSQKAFAEASGIDAGVISAINNYFRDKALNG